MKPVPKVLIVALAVALAVLTVLALTVAAGLAWRCSETETYHATNVAMDGESRRTDRFPFHVSEPLGVIDSYDTVVRERTCRVVSDGLRSTSEEK